MWITSHHVFCRKEVKEVPTLSQKRDKDGAPEL
jgi:hypothetical protein